MPQNEFRPIFLIRRKLFSRYFSLNLNSKIIKYSGVYFLLILSRAKNDSVVVDVNGVRMELTVVGISGKYAKLAFVAPPQVSIMRKELVDGNREVPMSL